MPADADICLLLEGTYPYVRGGVSAWLHQLIVGLPELRFALVFIGGRRSDYGQPRYGLPANVVHLEAHYLEDAFRPRGSKPVRMPPGLAAQVRDFHAQLRTLGGCAQPVPTRRAAAVREAALDSVLAGLERPWGVRLDQLRSSPEAWSMIRGAYLRAHPGSAFVDYFWTVRMMHGPLFQLARIARQAPAARAYHALSTGYAGFLGGLLRCSRQRPLILSEHGLYTKERRIDLHQAEWLEPRQSSHASSDSRTRTRSQLRELWIRYFETLGLLTYRAADPIIALYEGNRLRQIRDGAPAERTRLVANGIDVARFTKARARRPSVPPRVLGLIGRVVPIKDVRSFIRALSLVRQQLPDAAGWIAGGTEEDPGYAAECDALARSLGVQGALRRLGHREVEALMPELGLLLVTSISEGQPLVLLEAFASGLPCVATDVGACRELIEGRDDADRALGRAGRVVPFADAPALARAAVELLCDRHAYRSCQTAGLARVCAHYEQSAMLSTYRQVYRERMEA
jgi:glycosyltransferase involved in cell wall biosynthesis